MNIKRRAGAAVAAFAVVVLAACGSGSNEQEGTDMMRERTIEAFEASDPDLAEFAGEDGTKPEVIETPFVDKWHVFRLSGRHRATVVAVTKEGDPRGVVLTGHPEAWEKVVDGVRVEDTEEATQVADAWTRALRPTTGGTYLIRSVDDIKWSGPENEAAKTAEREIRRDHGDEIADQSTTVSGGDWTTSRWLVQDNDIKRLDLTVHADATVDSKSSTVREALPGPIPL